MGWISQACRVVDPEAQFTRWQLVDIADDQQRGGSSLLRCFRHQLLLRRARSSSPTGTVGNWLGTAHVIVPTRTETYMRMPADTRIPHGR